MATASPSAPMRKCAAQATSTPNAALAPAVGASATVNAARPIGLSPPCAAGYPHRPPATPAPRTVASRHVARVGVCDADPFRQPLEATVNWGGQPMMLQAEAAPGVHRVEDDNTNWYIVEGD